MIYDRASSLLDRREMGMPYDLTSLKRRPPKERAEAIKSMFGQFQDWGWPSNKIHKELLFLEAARAIDDEVYLEMGVLEKLDEARLKDILRVGREKFEKSRKEK